MFVRRLSASAGVSFPVGNFAVDTHGEGHGFANPGLATEVFYKCTNEHEFSYWLLLRLESSLTNYASFFDCLTAWLLGPVKRLVALQSFAQFFLNLVSDIFRFALRPLGRTS